MLTNLTEVAVYPHRDADDLYAALVANRFDDAIELASRGIGSDEVRSLVLTGDYQGAICTLVKRYPRATHLSNAEFSPLRLARAE